MPRYHTTLTGGVLLGTVQFNTSGVFCETVRVLELEDTEPMTAKENYNNKLSLHTISVYLKGMSHDYH